MPIDDLSAAHLASFGGSAAGWEEQRGNNGLLLLDLAALNLGVNPETAAPHGASSQLFTLSLQTFKIPAVTVESQETQFLNEKRKYAGGVSFDDMEVTVKDFVDIPTAHLIKTWHERVYDPVTGKIGLAKNYKTTGEVQLYAPDGSHTRYYTLRGIWPQNFDPGQIDMGSTEGIKLTITFSVDKVYASREYGSADLQTLRT